MNAIPRSNRLYLNVPAELAINTSINEVENLGCDVKLTEAIKLLSEAKGLVAKFIDETLKEYYNEN